MGLEGGLRHSSPGTPTARIAAQAVAFTTINIATAAADESAINSAIGYGPLWRLTAAWTPSLASQKPRCPHQSARKPTRVLWGKVAHGSALFYRDPFHARARSCTEVLVSSRRSPISGTTLGAFSLFGVANVCKPCTARRGHVQPSAAGDGLHRGAVPIRCASDRTTRAPAFRCCSFSSFFLCAAGHLSRTAGHQPDRDRRDIPL